MNRIYTVFTRKLCTTNKNNMCKSFNNRIEQSLIKSEKSLKKIREINDYDKVKIKLDKTINELIVVKKELNEMLYKRDIPLL